MHRVGATDGVKCNDQTSPQSHTQRNTTQAWSWRFTSLPGALRSIVTMLLSTSATCLATNSVDGRYPILGGQLATALRTGYFACIILGIGISSGSQGSVNWSDVIGLGGNHDVPVLHDLITLRPNFFQSDGIRAHGEFGKDKRLHYQSTRYFCRCLDAQCLNNRILLRHSSLKGDKKCFMAVDAAAPDRALGCGDFLLLVDGRRARVDAHVPALPFPKGVFLNDSKQGAVLHEIPITKIGEVREEVRDLVRVLRDEGEDDLDDFVSHWYSWHELSEGDNGAQAAGLAEVQAMVWKTIINSRSIKGDSGLWLYRKSRTEGGILASRGDSLLFSGASTGGVERSELQSHPLPPNLSNLLNNSLAYIGNQRQPTEAEAGQALLTALQCADDSGFAAEDTSALYKVVQEDIPCGGVENPFSAMVSTSPTIEAELAFAARNAPTPSSLAEVGLAILTALASIFGDPINSGTGFFISRLFRWNKKVRKVLKRGDAGDVAIHVSGQSLRTPNVEWWMDGSRAKFGRVLLAIAIIVLPDLVGFSIIYTPLALIISNEFEVNSWRHTTNDINMQITGTDGDESHMLVITPIVVTTKQRSNILRELLSLTLVLFLITLALHHQNVERWGAVVYRSYTGQAPKWYPKATRRLNNGWFEPWLIGILQGVDSNLTWSHGDILRDLGKKYVPHRPQGRRSPGAARRVTVELRTPSFNV